MTTVSIIRKTLRDLRWQVVWYGLGLALMGAFTVYVFPSYSKQMGDMQLPDSVKALIGNADYGTGPGFIGGEFFSWTPVMLTVFAIMAGTSALAGEEANGTIDILLSQPVSRSSLVIAKLVGIGIASLLICAFIYAGWLLSVPFVEIDLGLWELLLATLNLVPFVLFFAAFSMWAGAFMGSRQVATGVAVAISVVGFFITYLAELVDLIRPLRYVSPFFYNGGAKALIDGVDLPRLGVLLAATAILVLLTLRAFERRDIGVRSGAAWRLPWAHPAEAREHFNHA